MIFLKIFSVFGSYEKITEVEKLSMMKFQLLWLESGSTNHISCPIGKIRPDSSKSSYCKWQDSDTSWPDSDHYLRNLAKLAAGFQCPNPKIRKPSAQIYGLQQTPMFSGDEFPRKCVQE
jgi:hypothetical protein